MLGNVTAQNRGEVRVLRTRDLGRISPAEGLSICGRLDLQVKVNGVYLTTAGSNLARACADAWPWC